MTANGGELLCRVITAISLDDILRNELDSVWKIFSKKDGKINIKYFFLLF
jgi:uncharacterized protein YjaG (DUF416 family)